MSWLQEKVLGVLGREVMVLVERRRQACCGAPLLLDGVVAPEVHISLPQVQVRGMAERRGRRMMCFRRQRLLLTWMEFRREQQLRRGRLQFRLRGAQSCFRLGREPIEKEEYRLMTG